MWQGAAQRGERRGGVTPEPITIELPRSVRFPVMRQVWTDAVFLHWATAAQAAKIGLPEGTDLDLWDDEVYVGLIGLCIDVAVMGVPVPRIGSFAEINVRLYSVDRQGRRGIVFCSLDAGRLLPALAGRAGFRLPYMWADAEAVRGDGRVTYTSRRRWPGDNHPRTDFTVRIGQRLDAPSPMEHFLTARWALYWASVGRTWSAATEHEPWPLHRGHLESIEDELIAAAGLPAPSGDPISVLWSPRVSCLPRRSQAGVLIRPSAALQMCAAGYPARERRLARAPD